MVKNTRFFTKKPDPPQKKGKKQKDEQKNIDSPHILIDLNHYERTKLSVIETLT
jgi:hypothetical protein